MKIIRAANETRQPRTEKVLPRHRRSFLTAFISATNKSSGKTVADARQHNGHRAGSSRFDKHPNAIVAPDRVPPLIYLAAPKTSHDLNLSAPTFCWKFTFDKSFSEADWRNVYSVAGPRFRRERGSMSRSTLAMVRAAAGHKTRAPEHLRRARILSSATKRKRETFR